MTEVTHVQRVQLGCGTLILIAIIVMFFSRGGDVENEVRGLRAEVGELKRMIEQQSAEIRQLREKLSPPSPKATLEKGKE
jgi:predicted RNase H-like nuclease (RuvC/YqgF family)